MCIDTIAIDLGTSNSAAAVLGGGEPRRLAIETGSETLPTAVFFPSDGRPMQIGLAAFDGLMAGEEGRYMRALKSVLGTTLFHEERLIAGKRRTLSDIVTAFIAEMKLRAERTTDRCHARVLSGRPVHFHSGDPDRDARAEADLRACYLGAGFDDVIFMLEPEAAALASHGLGRAGEIGLIVDVGGGTSDFSVFRTERGVMSILASHGIRLGGTDFDHAVSMAQAMPLLGHGGALRREMGPGLLPVSNAVYVDLSTWARIPFLYAPETRRAVASMVRLAVDPRAMGRLSTVLVEELGHDLAFAVERDKKAANERQDARIEMHMIEPDLAVPLSEVSLDAALAHFCEPLREAVIETLRRAVVGAGQVANIVLVGGSSLMRLVAAEVCQVCPRATLRQAEVFTAVVDGLALATVPAGADSRGHPTVGETS